MYSNIIRNEVSIGYEYRFGLEEDRKQTNAYARCDVKILPRVLLRKSWEHIGNYGRRGLRCTILLKNQCGDDMELFLFDHLPYIHGIALTNYRVNGMRCYIQNAFDGYYVGILSPYETRAVTYIVWHPCCWNQDFWRGTPSAKIMYRIESNEDNPAAWRWQEE